MYGNPGQIVIQGTAILATLVYSGVMSFILLKLIGLVLPLRAEAEDEMMGLDISQHGEEAYLHAEGSGATTMGKTEGMTAQSVLTTVRAES
jgi:Amt family ammonium transporter